MATTANGVYYPVLGDAPNGPSQMQQLAQSVDHKIIGNFATAAARSAAITSPTTGDVTYRVDGKCFEMWNGTAWQGLFGQVVAQLRQTSAQSITNNTFTALTWQVADYDTASGLSSGVWTSPFTGIIRVSGMVQFTANTTGRRLGKITVGGVDVNGAQNELAALGAGASVNSIPIPPVRVAVTSGNVVALQAFQTSGGALNTYVTSPAQSVLLIEQVG